jgi:hypothetical protein
MAETAEVAHEQGMAEMTKGWIRDNKEGRDCRDDKGVD